MANGVTIFSGASEINGEPILGIMTGKDRPSTNPKTGDMLQLHILPRNSKPSDAVRNGDDAAVCGDCQHRPLLVAAAKKAGLEGLKSCYVQTWKAPNAVYKAAVSYPDHVSGSPLAKRRPPVRLGAWGEPASIPFDILAGYTADGHGHTGYTHRWRVCDQRYKTILMASVDSPAEYAEAAAMGWRCFRVRKADEPLLPNEITCPATKEAGHRTTCARCLLCAGTSKTAKDIATLEQ
jgi:hypothetical protein